MGSRKYNKRFIFLLIIAITIFAITAYMIYYENFPPRQPARATSLATWQQWGMSIQYPAGIKVSVHGISQEIATINLGMAIWTWNDNTTCLILGWRPLTDYNPTLFFQRGYDSLQKFVTNLTILDQGNMSIGGEVWTYQTYEYVLNGIVEYSTTALSAYNNSQRIYTLDFSDIYPDTLACIEYYGNTFNG